MNIRQNLIDRFIRYARIDTPVDLSMTGIQRPTNPKQLDLANLLITELKAMGIELYSNHEGFIIGRLPASGKGANLTPIGFMAHLDVTDDAPNTGVQPQLIASYDGKAIHLKDNIIIHPEETPELAQYIGTPIITSDGTTLLGADDKAGITIIMELANYFTSHPELEHGAFEVIFTPDEEGGDGMSGFPIKELQAKYAYTLDGNELGIINYECYNAYMAEIKFKGVSYHPGYARGRMVNPVSMLAAFINLLPRSESPEATDGYYGCYWPDHIHSSGEEASLVIHVRDHDNSIAQRRLEALAIYASAIEASFPGGKIEIKNKEIYRNMREEIDKQPEIMDRVIQAMRQNKLEPRFEPIRGGTDGARLTTMGVPCPNIFIGAHNIHSRKEWLSIVAAEKALETLINMLIVR